ncbi:ribosome biogenesis GTPase YqeH [Kyrpidia spormannii]|uniref:Ribosome biogenesis GTPase YqeH n=1 Tax=Kyrpidia spormannii TaxID=2055160 RepID=A0ACA8ZAP5_9BACL|nr:ribosome biogenesis GTPase YqeH [Kyrpidia spormannii]CAB3393017.1 Ribosome biogenesis GTPase YqeH [Kyrpidia spormannii]
MKVCSGCGEELQSEDPGKAGYVPAHRMDEPGVLCRRCYRIIHYQEIAPAAVPPERLRGVLARAKQERALVVQVVDILDWTGTRIPDLNDVARDRQWLVVHKIDLLPRETNYDRVRRWFERQLGREGFRVERVYLASAHKGIGIPGLLADLNRVDGAVYFMGAANTGKSSLLNALMGAAEISSDRPLTTSRVPGTTLNAVTIDRVEGRKWVDTPGITAGYRVVDRLCPTCLRAVVPVQPIRPRVYSLETGQSIWLGGLARLDVLEGDRQPFVCFLSNRVPIHRTNVLRAQPFFEKHAGKDLVPPCERCLAEVTPVARTEWKLEPGEKVDLAVAGLGWVSARGRGARVALFVPKGVETELRPALV